MIILGIDPGTATTGYGLIKKIGRDLLSCLDYGSIETSPSSSDAERLECLYDELSLLMRKTKPDVLAVEKLYFFKNSKTAMTVAQAKGVILLAGAKKRIPIFEFTPLQMKTTVAGYGRAEKSQIQKMVKVILNLKKIPRPDDAADALGIAICCARQI